MSPTRPGESGSREYTILDSNMCTSIDVSKAVPAFLLNSRLPDTDTGILLRRQTAPAEDTDSTRRKRPSSRRNATTAGTPEAKMKISTNLAEDNLTFITVPEDYKQEFGTLLRTKTAPAELGATAPRTPTWPHITRPRSPIKLKTCLRHVL